jgi:hypothetical protein
LEEFDDNAKILAGCTIAAVKPVERLTMFLSNVARHPDDYARLQASGSESAQDGEILPILVSTLSLRTELEARHGERYR